MLIRLDNVSMEFVFDTKHIHHIEVQEGNVKNMVLVLDDGTNRVITEEAYSTLVDKLYAYQDMMDI